MSSELLCHEKPVPLNGACRLTRDLSWDNQNTSKATEITLTCQLPIFSLTLSSFWCNRCHHPRSAAHILSKAWTCKLPPRDFAPSFAKSNAFLNALSASLEYDYQQFTLATLATFWLCSSWIAKILRSTVEFASVTMRQLSVTFNLSMCQIGSEKTQTEPWCNPVPHSCCFCSCHATALRYWWSPNGFCRPLSQVFQCSDVKLPTSFFEPTGLVLATVLYCKNRITIALTLSSGMRPRTMQNPFCSYSESLSLEGEDPILKSLLNVDTCACLVSWGT